MHLALLRRMDSSPLCKHFLLGRCLFGDACRYAHTSSPYAALQQQHYMHGAPTHMPYLGTPPAAFAGQHSLGSTPSPSMYHHHHTLQPMPPPFPAGPSPVASYATRTPSRSARRSSSGSYSSGRHHHKSVEPKFYERAWQDAPPELQELPASARQGCTPFTFRVLSYNLLADHLAWAHADYLYPDRVSNSHLDWFKHRQPLAIREMLHWSPDIICAQEVDHYPELARALAKEGFSGAFMQRTGGHRDGCATFWRTSRLVAVRMEHVAYNRYDLKDNVALLVHLAPRTGHAAEQQHPAQGSSPQHKRFDEGAPDAASESLQACTTPPQHAAGAQPLHRPSSPGTDKVSAPPPFASSSSATTPSPAVGITGAGVATDGAVGGFGSSHSNSKEASAAASAASAAAAVEAARAAGQEARGGVVVANTHIMFNTKRGDVKLGQLRTVLDRLNEMAQVAASEGVSVGCMLAGDYNSAPGSPLYQFLQNGELDLNQYDKHMLSGQVEGVGCRQYQRALHNGLPPKQGYKPNPPPTHSMTTSPTSHQEQHQHQHQEHHHNHHETQQQQQQHPTSQLQHEDDPQTQQQTPFQGPYPPSVYEPWDAQQPQEQQEHSNAKFSSQSEVQRPHQQQQQQQQLQQQLQHDDPSPPCPPGFGPATLPQQLLQNAPTCSMLDQQQLQNAPPLATINQQKQPLQNALSCSMLDQQQLQNTPPLTTISQQQSLLQGSFITFDQQQLLAQQVQQQQAMHGAGSPAVTQQVKQHQGLQGFKRYVPWDDEGLRLALGVCPTKLPVSADGGIDYRSPRGGAKAQRMDYSTQKDATRRQQARQGLLTAHVPLYPLQSAYATVTGHEPTFSTCHARCIDTVDYIWYTPFAVTSPTQQLPQVASVSNSSTPADVESNPKLTREGSLMECEGPGAQQQQHHRHHTAVGPPVLQPLRVLLAPDSTRFPFGMPNGRWASDHVLLCCDFRLLVPPARPQSQQQQ